MIFYITVK